MDSFHVYSYSSAAWLALQSIPLMIAPSIISIILSPQLHQISSLEEYLSRSLGITLLTLGVLCFLLTGSFPLTSTLSDSTISASSVDPYALPTVIITIFYHSLSAFYSYARFARTHQSGFVLGAIGSGGLAALGVWAILFGSGSHISTRTGADKRTSGWPFKSVAADKKRIPKKISLYHRDSSRGRDTRRR